MVVVVVVVVVEGAFAVVGGGLEVASLTSRSLSEVRYVSSTAVTRVGSLERSTRVGRAVGTADAARTLADHLSKMARRWARDWVSRDWLRDQRSAVVVALVAGEGCLRFFELVSFECEAMRAYRIDSSVDHRPTAAASTLATSGAFSVLEVEASERLLREVRAFWSLIRASTRRSRVWYCCLTARPFFASDAAAAERVEAMAAVSLARIALSAARSEDAGLVWLKALEEADPLEAEASSEYSVSPEECSLSIWVSSPALD